jgi:shikimate kinase
MNIVLIGYRCTGKSSVGKLLAFELERDFLDTDQLVETFSKESIEEIVERQGWEYFRNIEKKIIKKVSEKEDKIIATGGGVVADEENLQNLRKNGFLIWLKADRDTIGKRMGDDRRSGSVRPSLTGDHPEDEIGKVLRIREPYYKKAGNMEVDTTHLSETEVAHKIINKLPKEVIG